MADTLFPTRKRCKKCSKKLEAVVLEGLYCSYSCAGAPQPFSKPEQAPRGCRVERDGGWQWKQKFRYEGEVPAKLRQDPATNIYSCEHCRFLHVGHSRALGNEISRLVGDVATLASVLERARESRGKTKKQVAEALKVRPIRITEVEEGRPEASLEVVFKLVRYYRMKVQLLF
jgi:DNA-binding XRE family transcriptional regulator